MAHGRLAKAWRRAGKNKDVKDRRDNKDGRSRILFPLLSGVLFVLVVLFVLGFLLALFQASQAFANASGMLSS